MAAHSDNYVHMYLHDKIHCNLSFVISHLFICQREAMKDGGIRYGTVVKS